MRDGCAILRLIIRAASDLDEAGLVGSSLTRFAQSGAFASILTRGTWSCGSIVECMGREWRGRLV